jgi:hypothetical protein
MIKPIHLLLTSRNPVAHGEAGASNMGPNNTTLFNRELKLIRRPGSEVSVERARAALEQICDQFILPPDQIELLDALPGQGLLSVLFVSLVPKIYAGEGCGLFSGISRYEYLKTRLRDGANRSLSLSALWSYLSRKLGLTMPPVAYNETLSGFFSLPKGIQIQMINFMLDQPETCVIAAQFINSGAKEVKKAKAEAPTLFDSPDVPVERFRASDQQAADLAGYASSVIPVRLPSISGNSMRHCMLREPGALRLIEELGLSKETRIPIGVERFLFGGGNTAAGAKAPGNADLLEATMRKKYPLIDALGGTVDAFLLTRSQTSIAGWVVCKENNDCTEQFGVSSDVSIFDMLEEETRTRMGIGGKDKDSGQMIFSYEVLSAGLQVLVDLRFQPFTSDLTQSCVKQAICDWSAAGGYLGAKSAQGHGGFSVEALDGLDVGCGDQYLEFLRVNAEELRAGLLDATFGTEKVLCAA